MFYPEIMPSIPGIPNENLDEEPLCTGIVSNFYVTPDTLSRQETATQRASFHISVNYIGYTDIAIRATPPDNWPSINILAVNNYPLDGIEEVITPPGGWAYPSNWHIGVTNLTVTITDVDTNEIVGTGTTTFTVT